MAGPTSPLTEEHLSQIEDALKALSDARTQIDQAKRAGIDVSDAEKDVNEYETRLRAIKNVYFPGQ